MAFGGNGYRRSWKQMSLLYCAISVCLASDNLLWRRNKRRLIYASAFYSRLTLNPLFGHGISAASFNFENVKSAVILYVIVGASRAYRKSWKGFLGKQVPSSIRKPFCYCVGFLNTFAGGKKNDSGKSPFQFLRLQRKLCGLFQKQQTSHFTG